MSTEVASMAPSTRRRTSSHRPRAAAWESLGMRTSPRAEMKAVGRPSMGRDMPNMTPKAETAWETSMPPSTSFWGMRTAQAEPIRLPSRAVQATGRATLAMRRSRVRLVSGAPPLRRCRCHRAVRVQAEHTSQTTMPVTMRPTVRSGFWGRKRRRSPSTAPVRTTCSSSSEKAGGRTRPAP